MLRTSNIAILLSCGRGAAHEDIGNTRLQISEESVFQEQGLLGVVYGERFVSLVDGNRCVILFLLVHDEGDRDRSISAGLLVE